MNVIGSAITFKTEFDNQEFNGIPVAGTEQPVNREELIYTYGATARVDYRFIFGAKEQLNIKINASYTFADGQIDELEHLPFTAMHTVKAGVLFRLYDFSLNNSIIYRSDTYNNGSTDIDNHFTQTGNPSFLVWNAFAKYKIIKAKKIKLDVFVKVNNLLDNRYYHTTDNSLIGLRESPQDPIRFVAGVTIGFGG